MVPSFLLPERVTDNRQSQPFRKHRCFARPFTMAVDTASTKRPQQQVYHWLDDVEDLEGYVAGGYHPTHLGDEFSPGRYRIIHKLGFGGDSTGTQLLLTCICS